MKTNPNRILRCNSNDPSSFANPTLYPSCNPTSTSVHETESHVQHKSCLKSTRSQIKKRVTFVLPTANGQKNDSHHTQNTVTFHKNTTPIERHTQSKSRHVGKITPAPNMEIFRSALDSGATTNCFPAHYRGTDYQLTRPEHGILAQVANDEIITSVGKDVLNIPELPRSAREAHLFDEISIPLLSVNKICDSDLGVLFLGNNATVFKPTRSTVEIAGTPLLTGSRDKETEMYMVNVPSTTPRTLLGGNTLGSASYNDTKQTRAICSNQTTIPHSSNTTTNQNTTSTNQLNRIHKANSITIKSIPALINFYHMTMGAPPIRSWLNAIAKGWFTSFPGLTNDRVKKYCTNKVETAKGHLKLQRQHVNSTQPSRTQKSKTHDVTVHIIDLNGILGMDMTGRYPITSKRGHKYILTLIDCDSNYIKLIPLKSRKSETMVRAYQEAYEWYKSHGFIPRLLKLDNEISNALIQAINNNNLEYQLASPNDHRQNPAERAIQDLKAHFISIRAIADPNFGSENWDLLLQHTEDTLNMLRPSKINPKLSAYTTMRGHYNFMKTPMAPAGCKVVIHDRPMERGSWADRGTIGYYIEQSPQHYRNFNCYMPLTNSIRTSNTVEFFPHNTILPKLEPIDNVAIILTQLQELLSDLPQNNILAPPHHDLLNALYSIQGLLGIPSEQQDSPPTSKGGNQHQAPHEGPKTRSKTIKIFPNGTIIRKRFDKGWFEGQVTKHDPVTNYYQIKYTDGDAEEMTYSEVKQHRKPIQTFSPAQFLKPSITSHAKVPKPTQGPLRIQAHLVRALRAGCIWDEEQKKWMNLEDLLNHPNPHVRNIWEKSSQKEYGNLFQGFEDTKGMDVCEFIKKTDIPTNKKVTYPRTVVAYRPEKVDNPYRTRITAGGDQLDYDGETSTNSASMTTIKIHQNSVLSTPNARYTVADAGNMYLASTLREPQYVRFKLRQIPKDFQEKYRLNSFVDHAGYVYAKINKALYGLKESGRIANEDIVDHLALHGYHESEYTCGLFKHHNRNITFTLVVDDFGIKWTKKADLDHLLSILELKYKMKVDMDAKQYVGIDLQWDYDKRELICSMDEYIDTALLELQHITPKQVHHGPSKHVPPNYGAAIQYVEDSKASPLKPEQIKYIQKVIGKLLFMARAIDNTQLHALNELARTVARGTQETLAAATYLLNYVATHTRPRTRYRASDMILQIDSDASFQVCEGAKSRVGGYHYLGSKDYKEFNAPISVIAKVIKPVMGSAAEAEVAALHMNAQEAIPIRHCLEELGHKQPPTRIRTHNQTAQGFIRGTIKQKRSRTFDRQFWWLKDRTAQLQFDVIWDPGIYNLADYYTKHHPGSHHKKVRPIYLYEASSPTTLQGCIKIMDSGKNNANNARSVTRTTDRSCLTPVTKVGNNIAASYFINRIIATRRQALINLYSYLI